MTQSIAGTSSKADRVIQRMKQAGIFSRDLVEEFVTSPGPGGQNVNKVATCVVLTHRPTGEQVKCHRYRTQLANRVHARELLVDRLEKAAQHRVQAAKQARAKERARKRRRSAKSKERMLEQKHQRSEIKKSRKRVSRNDSICD